MTSRRSRNGAAVPQQRIDSASASAARRPRPLRIGISTRALFDLEEEHAVFLRHGVAAYVRLQLEREATLLGKGSGYEIIERLLALNPRDAAPQVEVVLLSRNSPDLSLRAFASIEAYGLTIRTGSFTGGRTLAPFIPAWGIDLFLSNEAVDVEAVIAAGGAAAKLGPVVHRRGVADDGDVRIALDGDAVIFSAESDGIFEREGLAAFLRHEAENAQTPMSGGPLRGLLKRLSELRNGCGQGEAKRVRIALVTSRSAPAHARMVHTLRAWGTEVDEAHFVGSGDKAPVLAAFGAHIFFDDKESHILSAARVVAAGHVPSPRAIASGDLALPSTIDADALPSAT